MFFFAHRTREPDRVRDTSLESGDQEEDTVSPGEEQLEDLEDQVEGALGKTGENGYR